MRDDRVRDGHQQTERALRDSSRFAEEHRRLLSGNRSRRTRWFAGRMPVAFRSRRCREADRFHRRKDRSRRAPRGPRAAPAHGPLCGMRRLPPGRFAVVFRRDFSRTQLRRVRQLPHAARHFRRHRGRTKTAFDRVAHARGVLHKERDVWAESSRRSADRCGQRAHPQMEARHAQHAWHRQGTLARGLAGVWTRTRAARFSAAGRRGISDGRTDGGRSAISQRARQGDTHAPAAARAWKAGSRRKRTPPQTHRRDRVRRNAFRNAAPAPPRNRRLTERSRVRDFRRCDAARNGARLSGERARVLKSQRSRREEAG